MSSATNNLFYQLKADGIYNKLFALYPFIGAAASPHRINAVNLTAFTISWSGVITHNTDGVKGNGTNGFGNTNWIQNNHTTTGNTSLGFYMVLSGNSAYDMGRQVAGGFLTLNNSQSSINFRAAINRGLVNFQTNMSGQTGFYGLARNSGTQVSYISPSNAGTTVNNTETATLATGTLGLMTLSGFGTASTKTYGTFVIAQGLSLSELQDLSSAITTFNNALGR
jgi:hypothetical protein